jgi:hypothetical protein
MRHRKRKDVAWPVDQDCPIASDRERLVAFEPSACRGRMTTSGIADIGAHCFERNHAFNKFKSCGDIVGAHNDGSAQTVSADKLRVVRKNKVNVVRRLSTIRKQVLKCTIAA